jgi:2-polyprenyl-3-methyl-5-hydroxy-6-metoxy-1,4-benzoquinol methylase
MSSVPVQPVPAARCLLCGGGLKPWFARDQRHYERCRDCGLIVVPEGLALDSEGRSIYESQEASIFEADGNEGYYFDDQTNLLNCRRKLAFVERRLARGSRLLDAGANFGHFLKAAEAVYQASGFELSQAAVEWSRGHFGVRNEPGSIYSPPSAGAPWDAITSWDVIEHLADPRSALLRLRELLKPGGWLFLSTPDASSLVARAMGRRWHYLDAVQHVTVFSRATLSELLRQTGFETVASAALGHSYRIRYVLDRLCYLHPSGGLGFAVRAARAAARPLAGRSIYLQLGDVVAVAARRSD